jgi:hypothetical protein
LALRIGPRGLLVESMTGTISDAGQLVLEMELDVVPIGRVTTPTARNNQLRTGNGQGESDCLIKTKHCDGWKQC